MKKKNHVNPIAFVRIHAYVHACSRPLCICFMHAYAYMHGHACACYGFRSYKRQVFLHLKLSLKRISHRPWAVPIPHVFTIKSHTWYIFKTHRKFYEKIQDSIEIMNQRRSFSQNILKSIFFWLMHFLALIFEFQVY